MFEWKAEQINFRSLAALYADNFENAFCFITESDSKKIRQFGSRNLNGVLSRVDRRPNRIKQMRFQIYYPYTLLWVEPSSCPKEQNRTEQNRPRTACRQLDIRFNCSIIPATNKSSLLNISENHFKPS